MKHQNWYQVTQLKPKILCLVNNISCIIKIPVEVNVEVFTFQGFSDQEQQYGKSGSKFKSLKDVMTHYGFKTMKNLEDNNQPHGNHVYMCTKEYGCVFY